MQCAAAWLLGQQLSTHSCAPSLSFCDAQRSVVADERDDGLSPQASACHVDLSVRWTAEVVSSVYATPLVTDALYGDGTSQVVVPTFVHALEALEVRTDAAVCLCSVASTHSRFSFQTGSGRRPGGRLPRVPRHPGAREPVHV